MKNNPYILPHNVYMRTLYLIRDYDKMKEQHEALLYELPSNDGQPKAKSVSSPTERKAIMREHLDKKITAISRALNKLPPEYRKGVFENVAYRAPYPLTYACIRTWKTWRARFVYYIADILGDIYIK